MRTVGVVEAKTQLARLLDQVMEGEKITITRHGQPVAMLVPVKHAHPQRNLSQVIAEIRATRKDSHLRGLSVKALVDEGRKY